MGEVSFTTSAPHADLAASDAYRSCGDIVLTLPLSVFS